MLQSALIVTGSGLVAFNQSFSAKPLVAAIGGLLKSVAALGQIATGLPLHVLEYERAIVVLSARTTVASSSALCAVILDRGPGPTPPGAVLFGKTLAAHLLTNFWDCYGRELTEGGGAHIVGRFKAFGARIPDLAADAARVLLRQCELGCGLLVHRPSRFHVFNIGASAAVGTRSGGDTVASALLVFDDASTQPPEGCDFPLPPAATADASAVGVGGGGAPLSAVADGRGIDSGGGSSEARASALHALVSAAGDLCETRSGKWVSPPCHTASACSPQCPLWATASAASAFPWLPPR